MQLRQLEYVLAVVEHGSFTAAAAAMFVSQPTLSQAIAALERDVGAELFERVGRGVRLSPAGEAFIPSARRALEEADNARLAAVNVLGLRVGRVRIITLPTLMVDPLARWVGAFRAAHHGVTVQIVQANEPRAVAEAVAAAEVELGLADLHGGHPGLRRDVVFDQDFYAICPPGTEILPEAPLVQLATLPVVVTMPGTPSRRVIEEGLADVGCEPVIAVEVDDRESILPLVLAGAGSAFVPRRLADLASRRGAVVVRPRPAMRRPISLMRRKTAVSPLAQAFVDIAARLDTDGSVEMEAARRGRAAEP